MKKAGAKRNGSILDLFLIFLFLLCLLGIILRQQELAQANSHAALRSYTLLMRTDSLDAQIGYCIEVGERLYTDAGEYVGTVRAVTALPAKETLLKDGTVYQGEWEMQERCRLSLELAVEGNVAEDSFLLDGRKLFSIGSAHILCGRYTSLSWYLIGIFPSEG